MCHYTHLWLLPSAPELAQSKPTLGQYWFNSGVVRGSMGDGVQEWEDGGKKVWLGSTGGCQLCQIKTSCRASWHDTRDIDSELGKSWSTEALYKILWIFQCMQQPPSLVAGEFFCSNLYFSLPSQGQSLARSCTNWVLWDTSNHSSCISCLSVRSQMRHYGLCHLVWELYRSPNKLVNDKTARANLMTLVQLNRVLVLVLKHGNKSWFILASYWFPAGS